MGQPRPLFRLFSVFPNKHHYIFTTNICEKYLFIIRCWDSKTRPLECESPPITTRPGPDPIKIFLHIFYATQFFMHSDWLLKNFNQSECIKIVQGKIYAENLYSIKLRAPAQFRLTFFHFFLFHFHF